MQGSKYETLQATSRGEVVNFNALATAAKDMGNVIEETPLRVSCPSCGIFVVSLLLIPAFVRARCSGCRMDIITLVDETREILTTTSKH